VREPTKTLLPPPTFSDNRLQASPVVIIDTRQLQRRLRLNLIFLS
jgi:hypothetical protein